MCSSLRGGPQGIWSFILILMYLCIVRPILFMLHWVVHVMHLASSSVLLQLCVQLQIYCKSSERFRTWEIQMRETGQLLQQAFLAGSSAVRLPFRVKYSKWWESQQYVIESRKQQRSEPWPLILWWRFKCTMQQRAKNGRSVNRLQNEIGYEKRWAGLGPHTKDVILVSLTHSLCLFFILRE